MGKTHKLKIREVRSPEAPAPIGPFSQAMRVTSAKEFLFISGQLPIDPTTNALIDEPEMATQQIMQSLKAILHEGGMDFSNVVKTTILLTDINDFPIVNKIYSSFLNIPYPARETFQAAALPKGARVEISMIAAQ